MAQHSRNAELHSINGGKNQKVAPGCCQRQSRAYCHDGLFQGFGHSAATQPSHPARSHQRMVAQAGRWSRFEESGQ